MPNVRLVCSCLFLLGEIIMFENKKNQLTIFLTGNIHLKMGEVTTIILEFGDMGVIKKMEVDGIEREFVESRNLYIKGGGEK